MSASGNAEVGVKRIGPEIIRVPGWERFDWLRAGFSTRFAGGSSVYGEGELNLGWTTADNPAVVGRNRQMFAVEVAHGAAMPLVTVRQVHSAVVRDLESEPEPWMTPDGKARMEGDGLISLAPGRLLAVLTADCTPVLVADTRTRSVGAFHAGWRGTLARIVERGVSEMGARYGSRPEDLVAAIGPCIGACCFEVGDEVRAGFAEEFAYGPELFSQSQEASGRSHLDLVEANRRQLVEAGIPEGGIRVLAECTACTRLPNGRRRYFSYRSEGGATGRMLSAIGTVG